jgi:hypothetical protein
VTTITQGAKFRPERHCGAPEDEAAACTEGQRDGLWEYCASSGSQGKEERGLLKAGIRADWAGRVGTSSEGI